MADDKLTTTYYKFTGGMDRKASQYELSPAQFFNTRNVDYDVPGAFTKRPGSTLVASILGSTTVPIFIKAIYEYKKFSGASFLMVVANQNLFYKNTQDGTLGGTPISLYYGDSQPPQMLTFNDKVWIANGVTCNSWDGSTLLPLGMPGAVNGLTSNALGIPVSDLITSASYWFTYSSFTTGFANGIAVMAAYGYQRIDGYVGPVDFIKQAVCISGQSLAVGATSGANISLLVMSGFTVPANLGISAIAVYLGMFLIGPQSGGTPGVQYRMRDLFGIDPPVLTGQLVPPPNGKLVSGFADINKFFLYTLIPTSTVTLAITFGAAGAPVAFSSALGISNIAFSGMPFCWFDTNVPRYIETGVANTMYYAGFTQNQSSFWYSDPGTPELIELNGNANDVGVITNDGDRITGMKFFNNEMIIFKQRSFHKHIGNDPTNFQLVTISTDYGCLSIRTVISFKQNLLWLDKKGIVEFNGSSFSIISTPVETFFRRMNLDAAFERACAVHYIERNQMWFAIPVDNSTQNNLIIVYDYYVGAWTVHNGPFPLSMTYAKNELDRPRVWMGGYTGNVSYFHESLFGDNGNAITCLIQSRFENAGGENQTTLWRRLFLDQLPATGTTGVIQTKVFTDYDRSTARATFTTYQASFQSRVEMGVQGKAIAIDITHASASLPFQLNGFALANRPLRNV